MLSMRASPELVFEPENDTDDYTLVTAFVNWEYDKIHKEEAGLQGAPAQEITQEITQEKDGRTVLHDKIVELMMEKPEIIVSEICNFAYYKASGGCARIL